MQCELFFSYNLEESFASIYDYLSKKSKPFRVICDNLSVHNKIKDKGFDTNLFSEIAPNDGTIAERSYHEAKNLQDEYLKIFKKIKYNENEIFRGFDFPLLRQMTILMKAKIILEEKKSTVFIFSGFFDIFFAILELSKSMGYSTNSKIGFLKNNNIEYVRLDTEIENPKFKNELSQKRLKNFLKYSTGDESFLKKIQSSAKLGSRILSYSINSIPYKFSRITQEDSIKHILKKIDKKISKYRNATSIFFITTTREDVYLKPWYPVFNRFKNEKIGCLILTSDFTTPMILSKKKIPFVSLFDEIKILENQFKNSIIGKTIKNQIIKTIEENNHVFGLKELSNYFIYQTFKTISIAIICEHILTKLKVNSTVAMADGEMLEIIALQISKKLKISNYSLLPVAIFPQPLLADWFHAEKILVHGNNGIDSLTSLGYEKNRLTITGNPRYDYVKEMDTKKSKSKLEEEFEIVSTKKLLVIAMGRYHKDDEIWMIELIKFCNKNNFEVIIKIHPIYKRVEHKDDINLNKIKTECKNQKFLITYDLNITTLLSAADLVITDYSSVGLETILLEKPLITVNLVKENLAYVIRYQDYGAALYVEEYSELEKSVVEIFNRNLHSDQLRLGRQKFIDEFNFKNDGNANKRIFEILTNKK